MDLSHWLSFLAGVVSVSAVFWLWRINKRRLNSAKQSHEIAPENRRTVEKSSIVEYDNRPNISKPYNDGDYGFGDESLAFKEPSTG